MKKIIKKMKSHMDKLFFKAKSGDDITYASDKQVEKATDLVIDKYGKALEELSKY